MASNEDMVPTGLPYGARQQVKSDMKLAGVPTTTPTADVATGGGPVLPGPTVPPTGAPAPAAPVDRQSLGGFDVLANREPTPQFQATPQRQVMFERVRQSDNAVLQSIFERMAGYKEG